jgi:hypothetical protein
MELELSQLTDEWHSVPQLKALSYRREHLLRRLRTDRLRLTTEEMEQHEHGEHHHQVENQLCPCHRHSPIVGYLYGPQSDRLQEGKKKQHAQDVETKIRQRHTPWQCSAS